MVALPDEVELQRIELFGLDQHLLPHADLSEIVEQPRVADLFDLFAGESDGAIGPVLGAVDHAGQSDGHVRDSSRVAERGRVTLLDRVHRGLHEPLEQPLDFFVQPAVLDRDRRLSRERGHELYGTPRVRHHLVLHAEAVLAAPADVEHQVVPSSRRTVELGTTWCSTSAGAASTASAWRLRL